MRICPQCQAKTDAAVCAADGARTVEFGQYIASQGDPFVGQVFEDRYRIDAVLGKGGFGAVYRGEQLAVGRTVAIKLLHIHHANDAKENARFQREARAIAALRHPNIVQVHDFGQTRDGFLYLVMELLEGRTLQAIIRDDAPVDPDLTIEYLLQALDGLAEAHSRGIIHRDLKPENIYCATIGRRSEVIKLLDFGIAKIIDDAERQASLTGKGMTVGSPFYMAPEQAPKPVSPQTDLYLVGLIAYELLTGHRPFSESRPMAAMMAQIRTPPAPMSIDGEPLKGPLVDLVMQCLEKDASRRPPSAEALMESLKACLGCAYSLEPTLKIPSAPDSLDGEEVHAEEVHAEAEEAALDPIMTPPGQFRAPSLEQLNARQREAKPRRRSAEGSPRVLPPTVIEHTSVKAAPKSSPALRVFFTVFLIVLVLGGLGLALWGFSGSESPREGERGALKALGSCEGSAQCASGHLCIDGRCQPE